MATTETKKKAPAKRVTQGNTRRGAPRAVKAAAPKAEKVAKVAKAPAANEATIYSMAGKSTGTIALPESVFGVKWNADLVHQVVTGMQANARETTANTKNRGEVRGGGKKPWKQKGTGRARHGSSRSPIWKGGGVTFGPRAERDFSVKINKKMRRAALLSVLSKKAKDGEIIFIDSFTFAAPKTKEAKAAIVAIAAGAKVERLATKASNAAIIVMPTKTEAVRKSFRNIGSFEIEEVRNLNVVDLLTHKYLVIAEPAKALEILARSKAA